MSIDRSKKQDPDDQPDGLTGIRFVRPRTKPLRIMVRITTAQGDRERCVAEVTAEELARASSDQEVWELVVRRVRLNVPGPAGDLIIGQLLVRGLKDGRHYG